MQPLKDYFSSLENFDDSEVKYSKPTENKTHIIPPEEPKKKRVLNLRIAQKTDEETLFIKSNTSLDKKEQWLELYRKALVSKKQNSYANAMKLGKFTITHKGNVMILPDLDISGDSKEILGKHWLKQK